MSADRNFVIVTNSNMARLANEHLGKIIDKKRNDYFSSMKNLCRTGDHDVVKYASTMSAIIALDDVQIEIKRQIDAANQLEKEVIENV